MRVSRKTLKRDGNFEHCLSGWDIDLSTDAVDNYGCWVGVVNNERFFSQRTVEELCSLCISTKELFVIALATSFWINVWRLKHIVAQYVNEGTLAPIFCNRLLSVGYSAMFIFLIIFSRSLSITWPFRFFNKTVQIPGKWNSEADPLSCFQLEKSHHLLPSVLETLVVILETPRILLLSPTSLFIQTTLKEPLLHRNKPYWYIEDALSFTTFQIK